MAENEPLKWLEKVSLTDMELGGHVCRKQQEVSHIGLKQPFTFFFNSFRLPIFWVCWYCTPTDMNG